MKSQSYKRYGVALMPAVSPLAQFELDIADVKRELKASKAIMFRYTTPIRKDPSIQSTSNEWWFCLKDTPVDLSSFTAKQRYRVNKGNKLNNIFIANNEDINTFSEDLYQSYIKSFSDYPKVYKPKSLPKKEDWILRMHEYTNNTDSDIWLVQDLASGKIIGHARCQLQDNMVHLSMVKIDPAFLKNEVNAALVFEICQHYINELHYDYVYDGERNIRHRTNYQNFLVSNLGFKYVYRKLHIIYNPYFEPFVKLLFPFRKFIERFENISPLLYNVSCLLKQEQIARTFL